MADLSNQSSQKKHTQCNKKSTRVDLTPMVDLGFILITFFVFTAALTDAKTMDMVVPNDKDISVNDPVCQSCALTILLSEKNRIYYYEGREEDAIYKTTDYSSKGIRQLIMDKKKNVIHKMGQDNLVLIIKPSAEASFKNLIDLVDECSISKVKRYYMDEITHKEKSRMAEITVPKMVR